MAPGLVFEMELKEIIYRHSDTSTTTRGEESSKHRQHKKVNVIRTTYFGKTLITDGKTNSTELDEFAYHESLVHPALLNFCQHIHNRNIKAPIRVFIGGGCDLATAREVLRYPLVEKVVMVVDLDESRVVDICVQYLPEWGGEAVKNNPRLELIIGDAYTYLLDCTDIFDIIILSMPCPTQLDQTGIGRIYTKELYQHAATTILSPNGVFVTQAGMADAVPPPHADAGPMDTTSFCPIHNTLTQVFTCVLSYTQPMPSFGCDWGFVMACGGPIGSTKGSETSRDDWGTIDVDTVDNLIESYIQDGEKALRMYDGVTHSRMFALCKALRTQLATDTRVMTKDNPVFFC